MAAHWVRFGVMGHLGRFRSVDRKRFAAGSTVVCRSGRGLELGEVLSDKGAGAAEPAGEIVRQATARDRRQADQLSRFKDAVIEQCTQTMHRQGIGTLLLDAELTLDGERLFLYFLGDVGPEVEQVAEQVGRSFKKTVRLHALTDLESLKSDSGFGRVGRPKTGCGQGCGQASPSGSSGCCATCPATRCRNRRSD